MKRSRAELIRISLAAVFMCLYVILNRFVSVYLPLGGISSVRIGFSSIPIVLSSLSCGPLWGALSGAGGDLIGAFAFPNGTGGYLYGYTVDQALLGIIPWVMMKLLRRKRKLLALVDLIFSLACGGLLSWVLFSESTAGSNGYEIPLNREEKIGLIAGLIILILLVNALSLYLGNRHLTDDSRLDQDTAQRLKLRIESLQSKEILDKPLLKVIRHDARCLIRGRPFIIKMYGIDDRDKAVETGRIIRSSCFSIIRLRSLASGGERFRPEYSFMDIYSILLFEMLTVKTALLAYWGQLYYGIPYSFGVFSDLLTGIVSLPILAVLTYLVIVPLSRMGMFQIGGKTNTYEEASRNTE